MTKHNFTYPITDIYYEPQYHTIVSFKPAPDQHLSIMHIGEYHGADSYTLTDYNDKQFYETLSAKQLEHFFKHNPHIYTALHIKC